MNFIQAIADEENQQMPRMMRSHCITTRAPKCSSRRLYCKPSPTKYWTHLVSPPATEFVRSDVRYRKKKPH